MRTNFVRYTVYSMVRPLYKLFSDIVARKEVMFGGMRMGQGEHLCSNRPGRTDEHGGVFLSMPINPWDTPTTTTH